MSNSKRRPGEVPRRMRKHLRECSLSEFPRYTQKLLQELPNMQLTPGLHHVHVYHDEWCDFLAGRGPCNCDPDVVLPAMGRN